MVYILYGITWTWYNHGNLCCYMVIYSFLTWTAAPRTSVCRLYVGIRHLSAMRPPGVGKCPTWTSPNYWGYNLQQILKSDVHNHQKGTFTNPMHWLMLTIVGSFKTGDPHPDFFQLFFGSAATTFWWNWLPSKSVNSWCQGSGPAAAAGCRRNRDTMGRREHLRSINSESHFWSGVPKTCHHFLGFVWSPFADKAMFRYKKKQIIAEDFGFWADNSWFHARKDPWIPRDSNDFRRRSRSGCRMRWGCEWGVP